MTKPYVAKLKKEAKRNELFRKVLFTGKSSQLVLMSLEPGEDIGSETHDVDQLLFVVEGEGKVVLDGRDERFEDGMVVCVPAGTRHNILNTDDEPMRLFTVYAPPQHAPGTVHVTKADAQAAEAEVLETQPV